MSARSDSIVDLEGPVRRHDDLGKLFGRRVVAAFLVLLLSAVAASAGPRPVPLPAQSAPGPFSKTGLPDGASAASNAATLLWWNDSSGAATYEYCVDTTNDGACSSWIDAGANTSVWIFGLAPFTTHYWTVRAVNPFGTTFSNGSPTAFWSFTTSGPFTKYLPADGATSVSLTPYLSWEISGGASGYEYCFDTSDDDACATWIQTSQSNVVLSGLAVGTTYYWHVRAIGPPGTIYSEGSNTAFWRFTTYSGLPAPFSKVNPQNNLTHAAPSPVLQWFPSTGSTGYEYCYDTTNDNACGVWLSSGATTAISLSGLQSSTTYYWNARAVNPAGSTDADGGTYWAFTTGVSPGAFSKIAPAGGATNVGTSPQLSWAPSANAQAYEYCFSTTNDGTCWPWRHVGAQTSVVLSGPLTLTGSTTYYWHVRASSIDGWLTYADASPSAFGSFTTYDAPPGAFGKLTPGDDQIGVETSPTLTWRAGSGATDYEYCIDTTNDSACAPWVSVGTNTSVNLDWLDFGTTYYWNVRATNAFGTTQADGAGSAFWHFTTRPYGRVPQTDFDSDGKADLLFQSLTGALYVWFMDGQTRLGGGFLSQSPVSPDLRVVGARDYTGDYKPDLLLQDQTNGTVVLHVMDGLTKLGEQIIPIAPGTPWRIVASGDVNGDGFADITWHHSGSGQFYAWFMKPSRGMAGHAGPGGTFAGDYLRDINSAVITLGTTTLGIVGTGDVEGSRTDLVLQDHVTGELKTWYLTGTSGVVQANLSPPAANPAWRIRAVADYSGDGRPDIIWQHLSSGALYYWQMNGAQLGSHGSLSSPAVNPIWTIVAPR